MAAKKNLTKAEALEDFRLTYQKYHKYGADKIALREDWSNFTDMLCKEGEITLHQYETWTNPF